MPDPEKIPILGVGVHRLTMEETAARIGEFISTEKPHLIITLGTEMVVMAQKNEAWKSRINSASLVVPDGGGLLWASRKLGTPLKEKVAGIELVEKLCALSADKGWKLFLLGGKPAVAEGAAASLSRKFPEARIVGTHHGYFQDEEILPVLREAAPDILLAGLGFPKQEEWLSLHLEELHIPVGIGVGGSFDVLSGALKRAPRWMIRLNLEWFFRFLQEPKRWKRIFNIPRFMFLVWKASLLGEIRSKR